MTLMDALTFLLVIIGILNLIVTVAFGTFDVATKIYERNQKNGQKK